MNKEEILNAVKAVKKDSKKRNFKQSVDLIINLKYFDAKKQPIESYVALPNGRGKKLKIAALVDKELSADAKNVFDFVILKDDFDEYQGKDKGLKRLAGEYDFFIGQANIMPVIATVFGKALGPRGKMPSPKNGSIVQQKMPSLKTVYDKLQNTVKIATKNEAIIKCPVGSEESKDEEIVENVMTVYNNVLSLLPQEAENINNVMVKLTMGKPVVIEGGRKE